MSSKTKSSETLREQIRMVCAIILDIHRHPQFKPELWKNIFMKCNVFPGSLTNWRFLKSMLFEPSDLIETFVNIILDLLTLLTFCWHRKIMPTQGHPKTWGLSFSLCKGDQLHKGGFSYMWSQATIQQVISCNQKLLPRNDVQTGQHTYHINPLTSS